jgi:dihydropyrimidinase
MSGGEIVLRGGTVVTAAGTTAADVLVRGERIAAVGIGLGGPEAEVVDVSGRYVLPGGVDPHTHLDVAFRGVPTSDDFTSGTAAALAGGTTSIVDFCLQAKGAGVRETYERWREKLAAHPPLADVGFHFAVTDLAPAGALEELAQLPAEGVASFKTYMAYPGRTMLEDGDLFRVMRVAAQTGATVLVHAENGHVIDVLVQEALAAGRTAPRWHARTRPPGSEAEAVARAAQLAELAGARLYVVHVSCAAALAEVVAARGRGADVVAETCPQYLLIDEARLDAPLEQAVGAVFTPPPRTAVDRGRLWAALADGALDVVSTDHCPFDLARKLPVPEPDFTQILNGAPGIEHRLVLLHHFGVRAGRLTLERWVELCATAPARLFGLAGRKGEIVPGADADLVVFDPARAWTITAAAQRSRVDHTPYEGMEVVGAVERVYLRGRLAVDGGEVVAPPGAGAFLRREPIGPAA